MDERKTFCPECREDVEFVVSDTQLEGNLNGEKYSYSGKVAHCVNCNSEIYFEEINDYNLEMLYDRYRNSKISL